MRLRYFGLLALPVALLALGAADPAPPLLPAVAALDPPPPGEVERIQAHLAVVERELLARDVSHLSARQRAARARHVQVLREYRQRGRFPHNHHFADRRVPFFVDEHGTLCAMAYLISRSGRGDLVERVAATRNNAYVPELADDAELVAWLEEAGLSLAEAARIQPTYGGPCCVQEEPDRVGTGTALASALSSAAGGMSIGMNLASARSADAPRWPGLLGIAAGAAGIALGADQLGRGGDAVALGAATAGVGVLSAGIGAWTLLRLPGDRDADAAAPEAPTGSPGASVSASPLVDAQRGGAGVVLRVTF